jgi:hypothetical protein
MVEEARAIGPSTPPTLANAGYNWTSTGLQSAVFLIDASTPVR